MTSSRLLGAWVAVVLLVGGAAAVARGDGEPSSGERRERAAPTTTSTAAPVDPVAPGDAPFAEDGPWRLAIPDDPALDERSDSIVARLSSGEPQAVANLYEYGIPIWDADGSAEPQVVPCLLDWGTCTIDGVPIPIPADAEATDVDADGVLVVVDYEAQLSYEFYEAERTADGWRTGWGARFELGGSGVGDEVNSVTGAGVSRLAGVVRINEVEDGEIDHPLVFSTDVACPGDYRVPASKTDGRNDVSGCIVHGTRVQLDPEVDLDAIEGLTAAERMVGRALQRYGAYAIDNGGARMAFSFERPSGEDDPYASVGLDRDYRRLDGLPWDRLRVLRTWDGS